MKMNYQETTLPNGFRVASARMPGVDSVALGVWVGVGGRYESRPMSGMSHFIEHLLFKGTRTRSARAISQSIEGRGGYFNAFTQEESTCYYARVASDFTWGVFDILTDMYLHPRFAEADINKERGVIIEEIMMYRDRPHSLVEDMLGELLWTKHALGRPLIGTPANIRRISRSDIMRFKQSKYVPSNSIVTFAGNIDHDECVRRVRRTLGRVRAGRAPTSTPVSRKTAQHHLAVKTKTIEQSHLAMGFRLFGRRDSRKYALKLLSVVLGENMSSRLFQTIRERHGLAYSVQSSVHLFEETGALVIQAGLDRRRTAKALELTLRELARLREKPVSRHELRRAKDYAIGQLRLSLESSTSQMLWIGENLMGYQKFTQPERVIRNLEKVTPEDVHRVANRVLRQKAASVAMVVPEEKSAHESMAAGQLDCLGN